MLLHDVILKSSCFHLQFFQFYFAFSVVMEWDGNLLTY